MTACSSCHASDGTFPPTDPQFVRFQSTTLPFSKCYTASNGKLDCVTCHDPHRPVETSPAFYEAKCLSCHGTHPGGAADGFRRVACPVNASSDCLKCHMPRIEEVAPHTSFTDHHIRAHGDPGEAFEMSDPTAIADGSASRTQRRIIAIAIPVLVAIVAGVYFLRGTSETSRLAREARAQVAAREFARARISLASWLRRDPNSSEAHYLLARVDLAEGHPQEVLIELARSMALGHSPDVLAPYYAVVQSQGDQGAQAEPLLRKSLADSDQPQPEIAEALAKLYIRTFRFKEADEPIRRWMHDAPDDPRPYLVLNEVEMRRDADHAVLIRNFKAAILRDPNLAEAHIGLANRYRLAHRPDEAADEYAAYLRLKPDDPEAHVGAGKTALERGDIDSRRPSLQPRPGTQSRRPRRPQAARPDRPDPRPIPPGPRPPRPRRGPRPV